MESRLTEAQHPDSKGLDIRDDAFILSCLMKGQQDALLALGDALPSLARASEAMAQAMKGEGRLIYAAAGSSGLMAMADAAELGGTFGISPDRIVIMMAGGAAS